MNFIGMFILMIIALFTGVMIGIYGAALNYTQQLADEELFFDGDYVPEEKLFFDGGYVPKEESTEETAEAEPEYSMLTEEDWEVIDGICGSIGD